MADCGCGVVKAAGDPNGRSISSLQGLRGVKKSKGTVTCKWEKRKGKKRWTCRDASGKRIAKPKKTKRGRR